MPGFLIAFSWNRSVCFVASVINTLIISLLVISSYLSYAVYFQLIETCTSTVGLIKTPRQSEWINAPSVLREKGEKKKESDRTMASTDTSKGTYYSYCDYIYVSCFLLTAL
jgi:hypothetical protein